MPISYQLLNIKNTESTLFSKSQPTEGQTMVLEITNTGTVGGDITLHPPSGDFVHGGFHFALCFEAGLLTAPEKVKITNEVKNRIYKFSDRIIDPEDHSDCYLFKLVEPSEMVLKVGETIKFTVSGLKIPDGETRNLRTTLKYRSMHEGAEDKTKPVDDSATKLATVLNALPFDLSDVEDLKSIDDIKNYLEELADIVVSPLRARIIDGWNFILTAKETEINIEISLNPHFFTAEGASAVVKPGEHGAKFTVESWNNNVTLSNTERSAEQNKIIISLPADFEVSQTQTFTIPVIYTDFSEIETNYLKINCKGFTIDTKSISLDKDGRLVTRASKPVDFDLHVPLYLGPLLIKEGMVGINRVPEADLDVAGTIQASVLNTAIISTNTLHVTGEELPGGVRAVALTVNGETRTNSLSVGDFVTMATNAETQLNRVNLNCDVHANSLSVGDFVTMATNAETQVNRVNLNCDVHTNSLSVGDLFTTQDDLVKVTGNADINHLTVDQFVTRTNKVSITDEGVHTNSLSVGDFVTMADNVVTIKGNIDNTGHIISTNQIIIEGQTLSAELVRKLILLPNPLVNIGHEF